MTRDDAQRKRTDTLSQGIEWLRPEKIGKGLQWLSGACSAMASGRRAEKSKGMALRCMGSDARRWLSNDTGSNGKDVQRCAERCNDEQRNGKERLRNARDEHGREKQGQGSARIGNDPQGQ